MLDDYPRSIELVIAIVLGWASWKGPQAMKYDGEKRMIDEQRR
jgi:hypothetical protein